MLQYKCKNLNIEYIEKNSDIQSAFLKGNTLILMMTFFPNEINDIKLPSDKKIKIKFEIDTENPTGGNTEFRYKMLPTPYEIQVYDEATLFAGKIHAILCRDYKHNVKGRDFYDYLFYIGKGTKFNIKYLENKLKNTGNKISDNETLTLSKVKELLAYRFETLDYQLAKNDVINFIKNKDSLNNWKKELFLATLDDLEEL